MAVIVCIGSENESRKLYVSSCELLDVDSPADDLLCQVMDDIQPQEKEPSVPCGNFRIYHSMFPFSVSMQVTHMPVSNEVHTGIRESEVQSANYRFG